MNLLDYFIQNKEQIITLLIEHINLTIISVCIAILIAIPLGVVISYKKNLSKPILSIANIVQAIPSMALLGFLIPFLGIGKLPAIVTVIMYSLLPIIKNTYTGLESINPNTLEAAKGIGLTRFQVLMKIQLPLALPVIMAGIRISAVTAVGLMTMAAFIGAGGLGYLVFSGIRTVNNSQILAGAIPACLLALAIDFIVAIIEKLVTPKNIQKNVNTKNRKYRKNILILSVSIVVIALLASSVTSGIKNDKSITIGGKDYTEQSVLTNLAAYMIEENTDISVKKKSDLGGTQVIFSALNEGNIDMYLEYMGTAYSDILKHPPINNMDEVYKTVKEEFKQKNDIQVLNPMLFNNTYALAVTKETAQKYNLETISDFAKVSKDFKSGTTFEFLNRDDGLLGLKKEYNFDLKEEIALDSSPRYVALKNGDVDVIDAFTTDGLIKKFDLKLLKDDKQFFPPYYVTPVIKSDVLNKYPEIEPVLNELGKILTDEVMMELNYKVDELHMDPSVVAKEFLVEKNLIKN